MLLFPLNSNSQSFREENTHKKVMKLTGLTELVRARTLRKTCLQRSINSEQLIEERGCLEVEQDTSEIQIL